MVSSNALIHCSLSSESRADKINISYYIGKCTQLCYKVYVNISSKIAICLNQERSIILICHIMYETDWLFNPFAPQLPVTTREDHTFLLQLVMSSVLTFKNNFVS